MSCGPALMSRTTSIWSERLEDAGCRVIYGFSDYKIHSKVCLITLKGKSGIQYVTQIGTGNFKTRRPQRPVHRPLPHHRGSRASAWMQEFFSRKHGWGKSGGAATTTSWSPPQHLEADHPPAHQGKRDRPRATTAASSSRR